MSRTALRIAVALASTLSATLTFAPASLGQAPRPSEAAIFGGAKAAVEPSPSETVETPAAPAVGPADPLKIGGMLYLRAQSTGLQNDALDRWAMSAPSLLDAYLDARPNQRVRGFVLLRTNFDLSMPEQGAAMPSDRQAEQPGSSSLLPPRTGGTRLLFDQLWLRFDINRTVFVTAGRQHDRWGTARFWTPTDFLHPNRRNPLDVFDARTGSTMLKLHLPWEARSWNFYGYAIAPTADQSPTLGKIAAAARLEMLLDSTEIGAGIVVQRGRTPKLAFDVSTALFDFDVYGELALRDSREVGRVRIDRNRGAGQEGETPPSLAAAVERAFPLAAVHGMASQVVAGLSYSRRYNDNDVVSVGVEYFNNGLGYDSPAHYLGVVLPRTQPLIEAPGFFYLGRNYAALFVSLPAPYSWNNTTFILSTLGNLTDRSFVTRLDYSLVVLTHLRFEAFAGVRYGAFDGEFRFGHRNVDIAGIAFSNPPAMVDVGVALRVNL
jgi:hypothetical protein